MELTSGRVAAITGAGGGIGLPPPWPWPARVAIAAIDVDQAAAEATALAVRRRGARLGAPGRRARDLDRMVATAGEVVAEHGWCNVIVNNAGVTSAGSFEAESMEDLHWLVDINVWGVVHGCRLPPHPPPPAQATS
ncbi:MAG: SDR family NAD(P)-dependent oxidoreductase [Acidimicrobiales bacterium]